MKIGFDLDGVITDYFQTFLDFYNDRYNENYKFEELIDYHLWNIGIGRTKEECLVYHDEFYDSEYFEKIPFVNGAENCLRRIKNNFGRNEIYFITSRPINHKEKTQNFINKNFPELKEKLFFTGDFNPKNAGLRNKSDICNELGVQIYVEDHYDFAVSCSEKGIKILLLKNPWNEIHWNEIRKNNNKSNGIIPVKNWNEILKEVKNGIRYRKKI